jgi:hypothetical protein
MNTAMPEAAAKPAAHAALKTWKLLAPDWAALDAIWRNHLPFILWPVGNQPLLAHWMDEAVRRGVDIVELYVADRPAEIRAWLGDGAYWSRQLRVIPISAESEAPKDATRADHLPGLEVLHLPDTATTLPAYWFDLQKQWLARRSKEDVTIDHLDPSGGWIGPQAKIHPSVKLTAPFWIGGRARIGRGCEIGPNALIGEGAILDGNVQVEEACVLPRTYLGRNTRLFGSAAAGNMLLDFHRACSAEIGEPFIMGAVIERSLRPRTFARVVAMLGWLLLSPLFRVISRSPDCRTVRDCSGKKFVLCTGRTGPLWVRRVPWLRHIAGGRLRWIGILPRGADEMALVPGEIAFALRDTAPGIFSLADIHGCHDPADPEEWMHAAFQASAAGENARAVVLRNLWKILWSQRTSPSPA